MIYVLYNPFAGNKTCEEQSRKLTDLYKDEQLIFRSMTDISYPEFFAGLKGEDRVIICGGDGTLNRFVNTPEKSTFTTISYITLRAAETTSCAISARKRAVLRS